MSNVIDFKPAIEKQAVQIEKMKKEMKLAANRARQQQQQGQIFWNVLFYDRDRMEDSEYLTREDAMRWADDYVFDQNSDYDDADTIQEGELVSYFHDDELGPLLLSSEDREFGYVREEFEPPCLQSDFI